MVTDLYFFSILEPFEEWGRHPHYLAFQGHGSLVGEDGSEFLEELWGFVRFGYQDVEAAGAGCPARAVLGHARPASSVLYRHRGHIHAEEVALVQHMQALVFRDCHVVSMPCYLQSRRKF